jgi:hypothetical protein
LKDNALKKEIQTVLAAEPKETPFVKNEDGDKRVAKYFFSIDNQHELYQMGNSFMKDFGMGAKSFAITSTGYKTSQQRTILALATFFDHVKPMKIAIITNQLLNGAFHEMVQASKDSEFRIPTLSAKTIPMKSFYHHFDFIDFQSLLNLSNLEATNFDFEHALAELVKSYDVLFWDIPDIETFKTNHKAYYPISMHFDSLSIIVSQSLSKAKEVENLKNFFTDYGVNVKGLLLDYSTKKEVKRKSLSPFSFLRRSVE